MTDAFLQVVSDAGADPRPNAVHRHHQTGDQKQVWVCTLGHFFTYQALGLPASFLAWTTCLRLHFVGFAGVEQGVDGSLAAGRLGVGHLFFQQLFIRVVIDVVEHTHGFGELRVTHA